MTGMVEFTSGPVRGFVADGFEPVAEEFSRNFTERSDVGAAFAVVRHGEVIVDLHGGSAAPGRPWNENTLQVIFSGTKGLVATCMLMLVDRGLLDLDRPVAHYWPKFAAADKGGLLVRDIVCHRSGLPGITGAALAADDVADDEAMESRLAAQPLSSDPNAYRCYHALVWGFCCQAILGSFCLIPLFDGGDHPFVPTCEPMERCAQTLSRMPLAAPAKPARNASLTVASTAPACRAGTSWHETIGGEARFAMARSRHNLVFGGPEGVRP
jgi:Beta-lactamase